MIRCDVLVVGGGQAALRAAIAAREENASVLIVTKGKIGKSGSSVISDGVHSAIFTPNDSPEVFAEDMMIGGKGINDPVRVKILAEECTERVKELETKFQVPIRYEEEVATPGQRFPRRVYAGGGVGKGITSKMASYAYDIGVQVIEKSMVVDLRTDDNKITGAVISSPNGVELINASSIILATGGIGGIYAQSDNPRDVTGEGIAMAWEAGAIIQDMEFTQFYPYRLIKPRNLDLYTKLFGVGAVMRNGNGERFMEVFPRKELETRDVLSYEMLEQGTVYLDIQDVDQTRLQSVSPQLAQLIKKGVEGPFIMSPVEHYTMGGICVDEWGRTEVEGLFAVGECTGGIHGANRLGGGSLTEAMVFGPRVGKMAVEEIIQTKINKLVDLSSYEEKGENSSILTDFKAKIQEQMWAGAGIKRSIDGIKKTMECIEKWNDRIQHSATLNHKTKRDLVRLCKTASMVAEAASIRHESRGAHRTIDFPEEKESWKGNIRIQGARMWFEPCKSSQTKSKT